MAKFFVTGALAFASVAAYCGYHEIVVKTDHRALCRKYADKERTKAMRHNMVVARATPNSPEARFENHSAEMAMMNVNYWEQKEKEGPYSFHENCPSQLVQQEINKKTHDFWTAFRRDSS